MQDTIQLTPNIQITNGKISKYIGHDKNFSPVLYFKPNERFKALDALANYLSHKEADALATLMGHVTEAQYESISTSIYRKALAEAFDMLFNEDYPITEVNGYKFTYLKPWKK